MKMHHQNLFFASALVASLSLLPTPQVGAQTFTTLHSFTNGSEGAGCYAGLVVSGDTLYGATVSGGSLGFGTLFKVNVDGTGYSTLHTFNNSAGANPYGTLLLSGNTLYGTTFWGGTGGWGTVFAINTNGTGFTNLHRFSTATGSFPNVTNTDGANPLSGLILSGNTLYGTAGNGGSAGKGTVFAVNTDGTGFTNLHNFTPTSGSPGTNNDGATPQASLTLAGATLYGTAINGGSSGYGTVFGMNTNGTGFTTLHSFGWSTNGSSPRFLILSGNTLYGTANAGGGISSGTVFALNTNGTGFTNLHIFSEAPFSTNSDGANVFSPLALLGNTLYGTTLGGGSSGKGTVFAVNTDGTSFTNLYTFTPTSGAGSTNSDGASLRAGLLSLGNIFYGTADRGGIFGYGTVFSLALGSVIVPQLTITPSGANMLLTWPTNAVGFLLQSTTNLASPVIWTTNAPEPMVVNGQNTVTNPVSGSEKFFRLIAP